jgi:hypothetical protein
MSETVPAATPAIESEPTPEKPNLYRRTQARFPRAVRAAQFTLAGVALFGAGAGLANARNNKEQLKEGAAEIAEGVDTVVDSVTSTDES